MGNSHSRRQYDIVIRAYRNKKRQHLNFVYLRHLLVSQPNKNCQVSPIKGTSIVKQIAYGYLFLSVNFSLFCNSPPVER